MDHQTKEFLVGMTELKTDLKHLGENYLRLRESVDELADRMDANTDTLTEKMEQLGRPLAGLPDILRRLSDLETDRREDRVILGKLLGFRKWLLGISVGSAPIGALLFEWLKGVVAGAGVKH